MDDFNLRKESNMRNVSMQNDKSISGNNEFNIVRQKKIVPDIGLDLIANQKRRIGSQSSMSSEEKEVNVDDESGFDDLKLDSGKIPFTAPSKVHDADQLSVSTGSGDVSESEDEISVNGGSETTSIYSADSSVNRSARHSAHHEEPRPQPVRQPSFEDIQAEKQNLLSKIKTMEERYGMTPSKRYTIMSNVDDLRSEYAMMKRQRGIEKTIKFGRKALLAVVSGVEYLNTRFDPISAKLEGWSEAMAEEVDDYDEIFEQLHDKYSDTLQMPPELSLLLGVGGSAIQYHIKKSLFTSNMPGLNEILRTNPDIMRNIATAAGNSMNRNVAQDNQPAPTYHQPAPTYQPPNVSRRQPAGPVNMGGNRMSHPSGVDDILNEIGSGRQDDRFEALSSASESTMLTKPNEISQGRTARRQKRMMQL
jgi:hypothetical protein